MLGQWPGADSYEFSGDVIAGQTLTRGAGLSPFETI
jgi:hypothetical protein